MNDNNKAIPLAIYRWICPNCGLSESSTRLIVGIPCERCIEDLHSLKLSTKLRIEDLHRKIFNFLNKKNRLNDRELGYKELVEIEGLVEEFSSMFNKCIGMEPWRVQVMWAKRVLRWSSFALIAPTGVGKTTFGIVISIYLAYKYKLRSIIILPTIILAEQVFKKTKEFVKKLSLDLEVVLYHSKISNIERKSVFEKIERGEFSIFITTAAFLRNKDNVSLVRSKLNLFFVDDIDSILKGGNILNRLLEVMDINSEVIKKIDKLTNRSYDKRTMDRLRELKEEINNSIKNVILVISSATGKVNVKRLRILKGIFGIEIGSSRYDLV